MFVMLRLKSRYLVDGVAIGSEEFLRRLTGKAATIADGQDASASMPSLGKPAGKPGVAMRFGQWGGLRVLRDLRVGVVGGEVA
jgi:hypothetical protein